jgi:hypothetical protein
MNHTQNLPFFKAKNHNKINFLSTYAKIDSSNNESFNMNQQEAMSVARAKDALTTNIISPKESLQALTNFETLKDALMLYFQRNNTTESFGNIATVPSFYEPQIDRVDLSESAKETFARIGERVRKEFIEEQIARADQYNIPYDVHNVNFLELSYKIDEYEELLGKAKDYCIDWDTSEYDPVALRQEIEEQERRASYENNYLYAYFAQSRGLEV